jgi:hypothetical protein
MNHSRQRGKEMKSFKKILIFVLITALLILEASTLLAQGPFSVLKGKVVGIRARMWLDVESDTDKAIVNFRIGRRTQYTPKRYPNPGERVEVQYLVQHGTPVAHFVNILEGPK